MRIAGLFAGIGGLELGLQQAGHEADFLCEIWKPAQVVLKTQFPDVDLISDIKDVHRLSESIDMLSAGFPCQDLSQAGMTAGIGGSKSGLVSHVFRLIDINEPEWVLLENVSFMLSLDRGNALRTIVDALEDRGYRWAYRVINSLAFLPQRRERVFILASKNGAPWDVLLSDEAAPAEVHTTLESHAHGFYWTEGIRGLGWAVDSVPTLKNGSTIGIPSPPAILMPDGRVIKPDIRDAERLQGFREHWTQSAESIARSSYRWSLVGNAVTVPVAEWLGRRLDEPGAFDPSRECSIETSKRWPRAAKSDGRNRAGVRISDFPVWHHRQPLHEFLLHPGSSLSARATSGFLLRTKRSSLRFPVGFLTKLADHLAVVRDNESQEQKTNGFFESQAIWAA